MRTLHLAGAVVIGAGFVGNGAHVAAGGVLMLVTGLVLYAIDLWHHPGLWRELAGAFIVVKLIVILAMLLVPGMAAALFWLVLVASSVVSHAPRAFRHMRLLG